MNKKGQFFSPDLTIAVLIFVFALMLYLVSSQSIFSQVNLINSRNQFDEVAHTSIATLVETPGVPVNWEQENIADVNVFGLAKSNNVIEPYKFDKLVEQLTNNYDESRQILGVGGFDFNIILADENGVVLVTAGGINDSHKNKLFYERTVRYNGQKAVLKGVFSLG